MKSLRIARAFGAAFGLVMLGAVAMAATSAYWGGNTPGTTGPWLGDANFNIASLWQAYVTGSGVNATPVISASQTTTQAGCTQLNSDMMQNVTTSASTGAVCLPPAVAGKMVYIGNSTGQTIDLFSSATPGVPGGATDTINTTAGTSAYTGLTTHKVADCVAVAAGAWFCSSGS